MIPFLAPPMVGAVIGYFTNYLAIKMLFRPLEQKRIFGIPLPMTPGIIPAKRKELATNIGRMIGDHLLTSDVIVSRLQRRDFQDVLYLAIARRFQTVFEQDLGPLTSLFPAEFDQDVERLTDRSRHYLYGLVGQLVEDEALDTLVADFLQQVGEQACTANLSSVVTVESYASFRLQLRDILGAWLQSAAVQDRLAREFDQLFSRLLASSKPLSQVVPADLRDLLISQLQQELPGLMDSLSRLLYDPNIRRQIKERIHQAIDSYVSKMGFWKKLLASWALQEDVLARKIDDLVDAAGEDVAAALQKPGVQNKVMELIIERLDSFLQIPVNELARKVSYQKLAGMRDYIKGKLLLLLVRQETADRCFSLFEQVLMSINNVPFSRLAAAVGLGALPDVIIEQARNKFLLVMRSKQLKRKFANSLHAVLSHYLHEVPIGRISLKVPYELLERGIVFTHRKAINLMETELPHLTASIDIPAMVEERINDLPVLQVEALLMDIMKEHFTYINIFGGVLGALIGGFQVLFMYYFY
ncbi:MAG: DUF445 family protein [Xanthomonadaceae bacterium]|nr:DUF445 family protein [Xanthomonadaceae bacterium]